MSSFASILSSIGGQAQTPLETTSKTAPGPSIAAPGTARPQANGATPATNNVAAGVKRKPEDQPAAPRAKVVKTEMNVPVRPTAQSDSNPSVARTAASAAPSAAGYQGTARAKSIPTTPKAAPKPVAKPGVTANSISTPPHPAAAAPKRGFASLLEKAKAAQEAAKAAGSSMIRHKPVEKLNRRDRLRLQEEAKRKPSAKTGKLAANDRSRSGTPLDAKGSLHKKSREETSYKGTMKKPVVKQDIAYKGTMNRAAPAGASAKPMAKKGLAKPSRNDYVDWDELDEAEDEEEEEDYESDSDMDAGFDDMEREETMALKVARKEDQAALEEEERHKQEKLERKRKLMELSKSAAARKKY